MMITHLTDLTNERAESGQPYYEFLRVPSMSAGLYHLPAGGIDMQKPHAEDEIYYVVSGVASIRVAEEDHPVAPGSIIYVPAGVDHRFHSILQDLTVMVFFAPAETSP